MKTITKDDIRGLKTSRRWYAIMPSY